MLHTLVHCAQDAAGHHSSALFVQWVPYELAGTSWEEQEERYVTHLLSIVDEFAPGALTAHICCFCSNGACGHLQ